MMDLRRREEFARLVDRVRPNGGEQAVVAFQGEAGAYGHLVIERIWGVRAWTIPCPTFAETVAVVERGKADFAVLPLHNAIIGEIAGVAERIDAAGLETMGEVRQTVTHCLLALPGSALAGLTVVRSHPAALAQCAAFLRRHPQLMAVDASDTAGAARDLAARGTRHEAVIADAGCADRYGLQLLERGIADRDDNTTTFVVVRASR